MTYDNSIANASAVANSALAAQGRKGAGAKTVGGGGGVNNFARMLGDTPMAALKAGMEHVERPNSRGGVGGSPTLPRSQLGVQQATLIARATEINHPQRGIAQAAQRMSANNGQNTTGTTKGHVDGDGAALAVRTASHRKGAQAVVSPPKPVPKEVAPTAAAGASSQLFGIERIKSGLTATQLGQLGLNVDALNSLGAKQSSNGEVGSDLGALSCKFESGSAGISAIGYDRNGGTSYGKFQISSRSGTMKQFVEYLKIEAPDIAEKLQGAGPSNTGGKQGKMPDTWKNLTEKDPERFEKLQDNFIKESHFMPAVDAIAKSTGLALESMSNTFKEVLFSTAVQHGPQGAARIFSKAIESIGQDKLSGNDKPELAQKAEEDVIRKVYNLRSGQFVSSTPAVQAAVKNRLKSEMSTALNMHKDNNGLA